jgi:hypothetical protein
MKEPVSGGSADPEAAQKSRFADRATRTSVEKAPYSSYPLALPLLANIELDLSVVGNAALTRISAPVLQRVGGGVQIFANTQLTTCEGALLQGVGDCP